MALRILHVLSQRPGRTGSGVTLDAIVRLAAAAGWEQSALVGVPAAETAPAIGGLPADAVHRVTFAPADGSAPPDLPFAVPGMSDVMPYPSSIWSALTADQLDLYRAAWRRRLQEVLAAERPDLIQTNHVWLLSALLKDLAPAVPVVATCHATGLRQMALCPRLADEVIAGCRRLDRFAVLHRDHRDVLAARLGIDPGRIVLVGAGFRDELFGGPAAVADLRRDQLLYVGKSSRAKGLPWLLDAVAALAAVRPGLRLHVAGGGAGLEAELLHARMDALAPLVVRHGPLDQARLADLMRRCAVLVLPSFYEGVPLVLAEAAACGCRLVATALPGVVSELAPHLGPRLTLVDPPRLLGIDEPRPEDLPAFTARLTAALDQALALPPEEAPASVLLASLSWQAVFSRLEAVWTDLLRTGALKEEPDSMDP